MQYDYGDIKRGLSFEESNFYETFRMMGFDLIRYDCIDQMQKIGKDMMNEKLLETVEAEKPDLAFFMLFKDELKFETLEKIKNSPKTISLNWFCDDHWRFENFSIKYAPFFNWITTTDLSSFNKYKSKEISNVLQTQWACNHFLYQKKDVVKDIDISFIGQPYGKRAVFIEKLKKEGIIVNLWGFGTPNGRTTTEGMIDIFNRSKINLNFSGSFRNKFKFWEKRRDQIKARHFEIPGCGGFQLSSYIKDISNYLLPDEDIVLYEDYTDLLRKIKYYLDNDTERERIASNGYKKVLENHTYEKRFKEIFSKIF